MTEKYLDCRGLACPKPVLETKGALESVGPGEEVVVTVLVDNEAARSNVERFAQSQGCSVEVEDLAEGQFRLTIRRGEGYAKRPVEIACETATEKVPVSTAVVFRSNTMGEGDEDLGALLMDAFCHTLLEVDPLPSLMVFYNKGVYLTTRGSNVLDALKEFESKGVRLLVCGTCLKHYGIEGEKEVGDTSNMFEILEALSRVEKVINP